MAVMFFDIGRMLFLAPTPDTADPLFALAITPDFYMHHLEVVDQDPARGSLYIIRWLKMPKNFLVPR